MVRIGIVFFLGWLFLIVPAGGEAMGDRGSDAVRSSDAAGSSTILLPRPRLSSEVSIEEAFLKRRSVREYSRDAVTLEQVGQLLWAAQGITDRERGYRAAPSAGATYPLETYVVAGEVKGLAPGLYKYIPEGHRLKRVADRDHRFGLSGAALGQEMIRDAPVSLVFTAVYERTAARYGDRAVRYVHMEAGHAAQNVYLQAVALDLGTVVVGAFEDQNVHKVLTLPREERPLYILPVGVPR